MYKVRFQCLVYQYLSVGHKNNYFLVLWLKYKIPHCRVVEYIWPRARLIIAAKKFSLLPQKEGSSKFCELLKDLSGRMNINVTVHSQLCISLLSELKSFNSSKELEPVLDFVRTLGEQFNKVLAYYKLCARRFCPLLLWFRI